MENGDLYVGIKKEMISVPELHELLVGRSFWAATENIAGCPFVPIDLERFLNDNYKPTIRFDVTVFTSVVYLDNVNHEDKRTYPGGNN